MGTTSALYFSCIYTLPKAINNKQYERSIRREKPSRECRCSKIRDTFPHPFRFSYGTFDTIERFHQSVPMKRSHLTVLPLPCYPALAMKALFPLGRQGRSPDRLQPLEE